MTTQGRATGRSVATEIARRQQAGERLRSILESPASGARDGSVMELLADTVAGMRTVDARREIAKITNQVPNVPKALARQVVRDARRQMREASNGDRVEKADLPTLPSRREREHAAGLHRPVADCPACAAEPESAAQS